MFNLTLVTFTLQDRVQRVISVLNFLIEKYTPLLYCDGMIWIALLVTRNSLSDVVSLTS